MSKKTCKNDQNLDPNGIKFDNYHDICVGLTVYNPGENDLKILDSFCEIIDLVILYDNSEHPDSGLQEKIGSCKNCKVLSSGKNDGVSIALNTMANFAVARGKSKIIFFDQDSELSDADLGIYLEKILSYDSSDVAIFSPNIICDYIGNENSYHYAPLISAREWVITSGSCLNLAAYKSIGEFDEKLFIDLVDTDFCIRAREKGYKLFQLSTPIMRHSLGDVRSVFNIKYYSHSPLRTYYQIRNKIYLSQKHIISNKLRVIASILKEVLKITLFEKMKILRFKMVVNAFFDARNGVMGKHSE